MEARSTDIFPPNCRKGITTSSLAQSQTLACSLSECLTAVDEEVVECRVFLARQLNSTRPAVKLPYETLEDIFAITCHWIVDPSSHSSLSVTAEQMRKTRFTICSVCTRWREIALTATSLWATAFIGQSALHYHNSSELIQAFVAAEVALAQKRAIALHLHEVPNIWMKDVINGLCQASPRYKSIHFFGEISDPGTFSRIFNFPGASVLNALYLDWNSPNRELRHEIIDLAPLSSMHTLCIGNTKFPGCNDLQIYQPCMSASITRMRLLGRVDIDSGLNLINASPHLQILEWCNHLPRLHNPHSNFDVIPLESLRYLRLRGDMPVRIFTKLQAPNLERLYLDSYDGSVDHILDGSTAHFPKLTVFEVCDIPLPKIAPFLSSHPGIRVFSFNLRWRTHDIERSTKFATQNEYTLPRLTALWTRALTQQMIPIIDALLRKRLSYEPSPRPFTLKVQEKVSVKFAECFMAKYDGRVELTAGGDTWDFWDGLW